MASSAAVLVLLKLALGNKKVIPAGRCGRRVIRNAPPIKTLAKRIIVESIVVIGENC
jgi:hypothetical protein